HRSVARRRRTGNGPRGSSCVQATERGGDATAAVDLWTPPPPPVSVPRARPTPFSARIDGSDFALPNRLLQDPPGESIGGEGDINAAFDCALCGACRCSGAGGELCVVGGRVRRWREPRHV